MDLEKAFPTESDFMAGKCCFKEKQWEASSQIPDGKKISSSVTNASAFWQLIELMDASLSSWIQKKKKHASELLTAHLLNRNITLSMVCLMWDGGLVSYHTGESFFLVCKEHCCVNLKFLHMYANVVFL